MSTWRQQLRHSFRVCPRPLPPVPTSSDFGEHLVQTGSRTVPEIGSTNTLATETDIDAISVAILMFWGQAFHWCIWRPNSTLPSARKNPRWRTYTNSSYNFVTENNIKVISVAAGQSIATEIASISVSVANLLVLPDLGTVSTSGLHWYCCLK